MNSISQKIKVIADFGKKYQEKYLFNEKQKTDLQNSLEKNWYETLKFFFTKSFMRGRKANISINFMNKAIKVLDKFFEERPINTLKKNGEWEKYLEKKLNKGGVNNEDDREMVKSIINFILGLNKYKYNLINYILQEYYRLKKKFDVKKIYNELDKIYAVGDKIASLFLRDVACIFDLKIPYEEQIYLQPIDTWVVQVLKKLNIVQNEVKNSSINGNIDLLKTVREAIIEHCDDAKVSSIEFNQGAWYIGFHSFEILFENLDKFMRNKK